MNQKQLCYYNFKIDLFPLYMKETELMVFFILHFLTRFCNGDKQKLIQERKKK